MERRHAAHQLTYASPGVLNTCCSGFCAAACRQGDVYVGSKWNILTVLLGLGFATPILGLLFAFLSYGTLWTGHYYGI
jgi:hypothetical protein